MYFRLKSSIGRSRIIVYSPFSVVDRADLYALGKALGGGILPVSAVAGRGDVLG